MVKFFTPLYEKVMLWAAHRHAPQYLALLSFAESSFFPVPPDVMLAPMTVARPSKALHFALITTVASVVGGVFGYAIGYLAFDAIEPWLQNSRYWANYLLARDNFAEWGVWIIFVAGFSPIPYKIFTITAGVLSLALLPFVLASVVGRGARFFLVAGVLMKFGPGIEPKLRRSVEWIGWITVLILLLWIVWAQFFNA